MGDASSPFKNDFHKYIELFVSHYYKQSCIQHSETGQARKSVWTKSSLIYSLNIII